MPITYKANQHFVEQIEAANTEGVLLEIWATMQAEAFISYKVTPESQYVP